MAGKLRHDRNDRLKRALGISSITFRFYRGRESHWQALMTDGSTLGVAVPNLATESTIIKFVADKLAKMGRAVQWPA